MKWDANEYYPTLSEKANDPRWFEALRKMDFTIGLLGHTRPFSMDHLRCFDILEEHGLLDLVQEDERELTIGQRAMARNRQAAKRLIWGWALDAIKALGFGVCLAIVLAAVVGLF